MNNEIEFKYRVNKIPQKYDKKINITQIYFNGLIKLDILKNIFEDVDFNTINTYRLRCIDNNKFVITLKTKGTLSRLEYEKEIDKDIFDSLIKDNILSIIIKDRYICKYQNYVFEFDEYYNLKEHLFTCEVELDSINSLKNEQASIEECLKNYFCLEFLDVTYDVRYKNSNLNKYF